MEVYKAVSKRDGRLRSVLGRYDKRGRCQAQLTYTPGKVTKPLFGRIFVFATFLDAKSFLGAGSAGWEQIWLAKTPEARPVSRIAKDGGSNCRNRFKSFWEGGLWGSKTMAAPPGTLTCPELTLIRKLNRHGD